MFKNLTPLYKKISSNKPKESHSEDYENLLKKFRDLSEKFEEKQKLLEFAQNEAIKSAKEKDKITTADFNVEPFVFWNVCATTE